MGYTLISHLKFRGSIPAGGMDILCSYLSDFDVNSKFKNIASEYCLQELGSSNDQTRAYEYVQKSWLARPAAESGEISFIPAIPLSY